MLPQTTLKFYLEVAYYIDRLEGVRTTTRVERSTNREVSVIDMVEHITRALEESTPPPNRVGFQPFPHLRALGNGWKELSNQLRQLVDDLSEEELESHPPTLGDALRNNIKERVAEFKRVFASEVEHRIIFVSFERTRLLDHLDIETWLSAEDLRIFQRTPKVAQQWFRDAGRSLAYGLSGACISLALQAVEATLRYYYRRRGGDPMITSRRGEKQFPGWGGMLEFLRKERRLPDDSFHELNKLAKSYRNLVAHGRARGQGPNLDVSLREAEEVLIDCWRAARKLAGDRRPELNLKYKVCSPLTFDTAVATYLFYWNPELPPIATHYFEQVAADKGSCILDTTLNPPSPICVEEGGSLAELVREQLYLQPSYAGTLDRLIEYVAKCHQHNDRGSRTRPLKREDVTLADLIEGVCYHAKGDWQTFLVESWRVLDQFFQSGLDPEISDLVESLGEESLSYKWLVAKHEPGGGGSTL
jgi:hypothetical protein